MSKTDYPALLLEERASLEEVALPSQTGTGPCTLAAALSDGGSPEFWPCHLQDAACAWCFPADLAGDPHGVGDMGAGHPSAAGFRPLLWDCA